MLQAGKSRIGAVIGAGLTGIETACEMPGKLLEAVARVGIGSSRLRTILADHAPRVGSDMGDSARPLIERALASLEIEGRTGVVVKARRYAIVDPSRATRTISGTVSCGCGGEVVPARFYRTNGGSEPVREWLKSLDKAGSPSDGAGIKTVEYGWPIGMPVSRPMGRVSTRSERICRARGSARVLFCIAGGEMILLHGFLKKSRQTPKTDLDLALDRKRTLEAAD